MPACRAIRERRQPALRNSALHFDLACDKEAVPAHHMVFCALCIFDFKTLSNAYYLRKMIE